MTLDTKHVRTCERDTCLVCYSWRQEKEEQALPHRLARLRTTDGLQAALDDYE